MLLGRRPDAPTDESLARQNAGEAATLAERRALAEAGGQLLASAFRFVGEMLPPASASAQTRAAEQRLRERLRACAEPGAGGELGLRVTLRPEALDALAATLARVLQRGG